MLKVQYVCLLIAGPDTASWRMSAFVALGCYESSCWLIDYMPN